MNMLDSPHWFFDELAHAGHEHLDPAYVAVYERKAGVDPTADVDLLRSLGLDAGSTLVDLGAGTGSFALAAAPFCDRVIAVDVSREMLAVVQERAEQRKRNNVECVQAGFLSYHHQGEPADFVYSRHALHHLPDFWKGLALQRIAGMLRPGGIFQLRDLIFSFQPDEAKAAIGAWLAAAPEHSAAGWTRTELETHLREEYSTFSWLLEPMIERAGFQIRQAEYSSSKIFAAYTCVKLTATT